MSVHDLMSALNRYEDSAAGLRGQLAAARQQMDDLRQFRDKHEWSSVGFAQLLDLWRVTLVNAGIDEQRVRVFAGYRQGFEAVMGTGRRHLSTRDAERLSIQDAIAVLQRKIEDLEDQQGVMNTRIDQTRTDLAQTRRTEANHAV